MSTSLVVIILCMFTFTTVICIMCLPTEVKRTDVNICTSACPSDEAIYQQTCISTCPSHSRKFETDLARYCLIDNEFSCLGMLCGGNFPYCYQTNCVKACPEYTVTYNDTCVLTCPEEAPYVIADNCTGICLTGKKVCYNKCPDTHPFVFRSKSFNYCLHSCPVFTYVSDKSTCNTKCPRTSPYLLNNTCYNFCPKTHGFIATKISKYSIIPMCRQSCPDQTVVNVNVCVEFCPSGKHLFNKTCVEKCPKSHPYLYPRNEDFVRRDINRLGRASYICVNSCDVELSIPWILGKYKNTYYRYEKPATLLYKNICKIQCPTNARINSNGTCVEECPDKNSFLQPITNFGTTMTCVNNCSNVIYNNTCIDYCPFDAHYRFNKTCYKSCPTDYRFMQRNTFDYSCVGRCETLYYGTKCVSMCSAQAKYQHNSTCKSKCGGGLPFTHKNICLHVCPNLQTLNRECVDVCPNEEKYEFNSSCVPLCSGLLPYTYKQTTSDEVYPHLKHIKYMCKQLCPRDTFIYKDNECVSSCPSDANLIFNSSCVRECPFTNPVNYTKNGNRHGIYYCVKSCPNTTYVYNETCFDKCPDEVKYQHNKTCVSKCDGDLPFTSRTVFWDHRKPYEEQHVNICLESCPKLSTLSKECINICPTGAKYEFNSTCVPSCYGNLPYVYKNTTTDEFYPYKKHVKYICKQSCPGDTFIYNNTKCVTSCPTEANFIFNTSCVYECPGTHPINYTKNGKGYGIYQCVESCPNNSYIYNETCYDKCPGKLKTHLFTCIEKCPTSYPYGNIQPLDKELLQKANIIKCLKMCPNGTVINEYFCDKQCPTDMPYLEKNQCVKVCHNPSAVYEITNQGKKCYDTCPNHLLLMDDICVEKCPTNRLIIESSCKNTKKCPYHIYQEQLEIGKRCTNKCSSTFYLDGSDCIKECPQQKVIAGMNCLDECPLSFPLSHKDFSSKPRVHCYGICPSGYVANGTECIESSKCHDKNHFTYNNRCYDKCPDLTIEYGNKSCMSMNIFITFLVVCILFIVILLTFVYIATCFNGWSSRRKKCTLTHKQENQGYQDANKSYTPPLELLEDDVENKQSEHFNNIKLRSDSQDIREELDDGFTINIERDNTVKYKRVTKAETVKSNVQLMHRNDNNETKDNHVEVLSIDKR